MPCRYEESPSEIYERAKQDVLEDLGGATKELLTEKDSWKARYASLVEDQRTLVEKNKQWNARVNFQERVFCKVTNFLFDHNKKLLIELLASDEEVSRFFWEHQQIDHQQGRDFIARIGEELYRVTK